jgi:hypothetical protein
MWGKLSSGFAYARRNVASRFALAAGIGIGAVSIAAGNAVAQVAPEYQYAPRIFADEVPRGETVRTRARPELDALGVHVGSFYLYPSIAGGVAYNDNVFYTDSNTKSDFVYTVAPRVELKSDWNNHSLTASAGGRFDFYNDETSENSEDAYANVAGRLDISRNSVMRAHANVQRAHEDRSDPNDVAGTSEPTVFYILEGGLNGTHRFNRVTVSLGNDIRRFQYTDTSATAGGTIDNSDRDYTQLRPGVQVGYEFSPGYSAYLRGEGDIRRYDKKDSSGATHDSKGYDFVGGASVDLTGLLFGDFYAGIRQQFYDASQFDTLTGPVVGSKLTWIPTGLTTVVLNIENQLIESVMSNSSGYSSTAADLTVDHELLRNLILSAGAGIRYDDFEGISRTDKYFTGRVGADYLWNRYLSLGARYRYLGRDSDASGADFSSNIISLLLTAKL